jgi:solute:Na+ symporter, SSS family
VLPQISFTWFALIGSLTVFLVGVWFKTPPEVIAAAKRKIESSDSDDHLPPSMRVDTPE